MMVELSKIENRATFIGRFERLSKKRGWMGREEMTILLKDIKTTDGDLAADHVWLNMTDRFSVLCLQPVDVVQFGVRVKLYEKGYLGYREDVHSPGSLDYKLSYPTNVVLVDKKTDEEQR